MISFLKKIFSGQNTPKEKPEPERDAPILYEGLSIVAAPQKTDDGQWRLAGYVCMTKDGVDMERVLIRVDSFMSREEAVKYTIQKAQQVIDEQGEGLFAGGEPTGRA